MTVPCKLASLTTQGFNPIFSPSGFVGWHLSGKTTATAQGGLVTVLDMYLRILSPVIHA